MILWVGKHEIATRKWTPFVFCEPIHDDDEERLPLTHIDVTGTSGEEVVDLINKVAPEVFTFTDDVISAAMDD